MTTKQIKQSIVSAITGIGRNATPSLVGKVWHAYMVSSYGHEVDLEDAMRDVFGENCPDWED